MKLKVVFYLIFFLFLIFANVFHVQSGEEITKNFISFSLLMLKIVPVVFVLIGLFEVWVKRETIEKHLGEESSWVSFVWAIILSSTTVGGLYVAFPIAAVLHSKGAKLSVIFTYVGAAAVCRVPMAIFEATFMGIKFTLIRLLVSIPLIILSSIILSGVINKTTFVINKE